LGIFLGRRSSSSSPEPRLANAEADPSKGGEVPMEYSLKLTMCQAAFDTSSLLPRRSNVKQLLATKYSSNRTNCSRAIPHAILSDYQYTTNNG
jgi:hypothetical protein